MGCPTRFVDVLEFALLNLSVSLVVEEENIDDEHSSSSGRYSVVVVAVVEAIAKG